MGLFEENWFFRNIMVWTKTNPAPRLSKTNFVFANEYIIYELNNPETKPGQVTFNYLGHKEMFNTTIIPSLQGKER